MSVPVLFFDIFNIYPRNLPNLRRHLIRRDADSAHRDAPSDPRLSLPSRDCKECPMALRAIKADETQLGPCPSLRFNGAEFRA